MDLEIISTVLAVARARSFSAAAYIIPCAQSSVSRRVSAAESELGIQLFERPMDSSDNLLHLTPAGERAIPIMEKILDDYRELFSVASDQNASQRTIHIGFCSKLMFPPMAYSMMKTDLFEYHPNLVLDMIIDTTENLLVHLKSRRLDAVIFACLSIPPDAVPLSDQFDFTLLGEGQQYVVVSDQHPLAEKGMVRLESLKDETFYICSDPRENTSGIEFVDDARFMKLAKDEFGISLTQQALSTKMLDVRYNLARCNKGVFLSFTPPAWRRNPGIAYLEIEELKDWPLKFYMISAKAKKNAELGVFSRFMTNSLQSKPSKAVPIS